MRHQMTMSVTRWASRSLIIAIAVIAALLAALLTAPGARALNDTGDGGVYVPTSGRILETRNGTGGFSTPFPAGTWRTVRVAGLAGVPASGAGAVSMVITAAAPTGLGQLVGRPDSNTASTLLLTYAGGNLGTTSNTAVLAVGADGTIQLQANQQTDLIIDVQGYYTSNAGGTAAGGFVPLPGKQIVDTRSGQGAPKSPLSPGQSFTVQVTGSNGIPAGASALAANYDVINKGTNQGFITPYATGTTRPATSLNYPGVQNSSTSMSAQVALSSDGKLTVYNASGAASTIDVIVVIQGYFTATGAGAAFTPATGRVYDTRTAKTTVASNGALSIPVAGKGGAPVMGSGLQAVAVTLTAIHAANSDGWAGVWADGTTEPNPLTSINYTPNSIRSNTVTVQVGANGAIKIRNNSADPTDFVIDLQGWYSNPLAPVLSCPAPYAAGSWIRTVPSDDIPCSLSTTATDSRDDSNVTVTVDGDMRAPVSRSDSQATTATVNVDGDAGAHVITASQRNPDGTTSDVTYAFGIGDWASATITPFLPDGASTSTTPTLGVEALSDRIPTDATVDFTIFDANGVQIADSGTTSLSWPVPSGSLQISSDYTWSATVTAPSGGDVTASTVLTPRWSFDTGGVITTPNAETENGDSANQPNNGTPATTTITIDGTSNASNGGALRAASSTSYHVVCTMSTENVHQSKKVGPTEFKTRVGCVGSGLSSVMVRVRGGIYFYPAASKTTVPGKQQIRASSDQTRAVTVRLNKPLQETFYTPRVGESAGHGTGFWIGTATAVATAPTQSAIGVSSKQVFASFN
ncbi:hypothetical protein [Curtobacterium sp. RRHDQ10]|uniref:hypothetical protein n=1 Tax=Curtobacterium phyllosphaerae TaxID=3413379 RepID=UPI003BF0743E